MAPPGRPAAWAHLMPDDDDLPDHDYASIYGPAALHARRLARLAALLARQDKAIAQLDALRQRQDVRIAQLDALLHTPRDTDGPHFPSL